MLCEYVVEEYESGKWTRRGHFADECNAVALAKARECRDQILDSEPMAELRIEMAFTVCYVRLSEWGSHSAFKRPLSGLPIENLGATG